MISQLHKLVALVTYGNALLSHFHDEDKIHHLIAHQCYNVEFIEKSDIDIAGSTRILATSAESWFKLLKEDGANRILIHYNLARDGGLPDHIAAAFVGGGSNWVIEVRFDQYSHYYQVTDDHGKDQFIRSREEHGHSTDSLDIQKVRTRLEKVLSSLIELASTTPETEHWTANFRAALSFLQMEDFSDDRDFIPEKIYSVQARLLLQAAYSSWVFGGMGSWNDVVFQGDDHLLYEKLTSELYDAVCSSLVAVVNSYSVS